MTTRPMIKPYGRSRFSFVIDKTNWHNRSVKGNNCLDIADMSRRSRDTPAGCWNKFIISRVRVPLLKKLFFRLALLDQTSFSLHSFKQNINFKIKTKIFSKFPKYKMNNLKLTVKVERCKVNKTKSPYNKTNQNKKE